MFLQFSGPFAGANTDLNMLADSNSLETIQEVIARVDGADHNIYGFDYRQNL